VNFFIIISTREREMDGGEREFCWRQCFTRLTHSLIIPTLLQFRSKIEEEDEEEEGGR